MAGRAGELLTLPPISFPSRVHQDIYSQKGSGPCSMAGDGSTSLTFQVNQQELVQFTRARRGTVGGQMDQIPAVMGYELGWGNPVGSVYKGSR